MKKKGIYFLTFIIITFSLYACGKKEEGDSRQGNDQVGEAGDQQKDQTTDTNKNEESADKDADTQENTAEVTIKEQVLYDKDNFKITATSIDMDEFLGPEINVLIENNTDKNLTVQTRDVSINGLMIEPTFSSDVAAGKRANDSISFFSEDLQNNRIDKIAEIELRFNIFTSEDFDTIAETDPIMITTSAKDTYVQSYDDSGDVLYDKNGVRIIDKGLATDELFGPEIRVYIENNTAQAITVQAQNVSINGFMTDPIFSSDIAPAKKINDGITFIDLEENGIEKIEEAELSFIIFDMDSLDTIDESDTIKLKYD